VTSGTAATRTTSPRPVPEQFREARASGPPFYLRATAPTSNKTDRNGNDGIHITDLDPDLTLTGNHTWFNSNLGIEAVPSTLGGGNWAKHNGNPAQCVPASLCSTKGNPKK
jgi:hypothetical protein